MQAIIEVGGKQYTITEGQRFNVDRLNVDIGTVVDLPVLMTIDGEKIATGTPYIKGVIAKVKVLEQFKDKKILVFKYKAKKNVRKRQGHRQPYTKVLVEKIG